MDGCPRITSVGGCGSSGRRSRKTPVGKTEMKTCKVPDCSKPTACRGMCATHYKRFLAHGDPLKTLKRRYSPGETCAIQNCNRKPVGHGLCMAHWQRRRNGSPLPDSAAISKSTNKGGRQNPNWKGGVISDGHGRVLIYAPGHPHPNWNGTHVYRYRLVVEEQLKRFLCPPEVVHHLNEQPSDDRLENLQVMTQAEHAKIHSTKTFNNRRNHEIHRL